MNKYCCKVLRHIASPLTNKSTSALMELMCPAFAEQSLNYLKEKGYIEHTVVLYNVCEPHEASEADNWYITLKGLDYLEETKKNSISYWIPIVISNLFAMAALIISILK